MDTLNKAWQSIEEGDLPGALRSVKDFIAANPYLLNCDELSAIDEDFERMVSYMLRGFDDPSRAALYETLLRRLWLFTADAALAWKIKNDALLMTAARHAGQQRLTDEQIREQLESFVGDIALADIDDTVNTDDIYTAHYHLLSRIFDQILVSQQWKQSDAEFYTKLITTPTIETDDAQLLISAVTMACISLFDINKATTLHDVYKLSTNEQLRQRALVGFVLSLPTIPHPFSAELRHLAGDLCSDKDRQREVVDLQKQMALCMNAERDNERIQRDIIPTLIKNNNLSITRGGIIEKDDTTDDILGTDDDDHRMEEMEKGIGQMMQMQRAGSDIYFGGFSQMKRFPFFYTLSNWFIPFSPHHPDLRTAVSKLSDTKLLGNLLDYGPFCDSDKYSFTIALSSIVDKIPESMREMLNSSEALGPIDPQQESTADKPAYIRRMYLQDLYRFFKLYPQRSSLTNPFDDSRRPLVTHSAFGSSAIGRYANDLAVFFHKQSNGRAMGEVLRSFDDADDAQRLMLKGIYYITYADEPARAVECLTTLGNMAADDDNIEAADCYRRCEPLLGRALMLTHDYGGAERIYERLYNANTSKSYGLNYCVALANGGKYDKAVNIAYRLDMDHHDDINVVRLLAWTLMGQKKTADAERHYERLLAHPKHNAGDCLNAAYCQWFLGNVAAAADLFRCYLQPDGDETTTPLDQAFAADDDMLCLFGISAADRRLMMYIVEGKKDED